MKGWLGALEEGLVAAVGLVDVGLVGDLPASSPYMVTLSKDGRVGIQYTLPHGFMPYAR